MTITTSVTLAGLLLIGAAVLTDESTVGARSPVDDFSPTVMMRTFSADLQDPDAALTLVTPHSQAFGVVLGLRSSDRFYNFVRFDTDRPDLRLAEVAFHSPTLFVGRLSTTTSDAQTRNATLHQGGDDLWFVGEKDQSRGGWSFTGLARSRRSEVVIGAGSPDVSDSDATLAIRNLFETITRSGAVESVQRGIFDQTGPVRTAADVVDLVDPMFWSSADDPDVLNVRTTTWKQLGSVGDMTLGQAEVACSRGGMTWRGLVFLCSSKLGEPPRIWFAIPTYTCQYH